MAEIKSLKNYISKVHIVEDNPEVCEFYSVLFSEAGIEIIINERLTPAEQMFAFPTELLICDWQIGSQSAEGWLLELKALNRLPTYTIIVTGRDDFVIEEFCRKYGISLITKPFSIDALIDLIIAMVETKNKLI